MKVKAKISKKDTKKSDKKPIATVEVGEMTTTVVSWGRKANAAFNLFPPGLFGVKAITYGTMGCVILKDDGTLTAWDIVGPGGRTAFHQHLDTVKDVVRVKASYTEERDLQKTGVYIWKTNGSCEFHCVDFGNGQEVQVVDLGTGIVDVFLGGRDGIVSDVTLLADGTLKAFFVLKNGVKEVDEDVQTYLKNVELLSDKIRSNPKIKLCSCRGVHLCSSYPEDGMSIIWADEKGLLRMESVGKTYEMAPKGISGVEGIAGGNIVLQNGQLKMLDYKMTLTDLPDYGGYHSQEPIVGLKDFGRDGYAIGVSASGRTFLVTSHFAIKFEYRVFYSTKHLSPPEWMITDVIYSPSAETFIGIRKVPVAEKIAFQLSNSKPTGKAGPLIVVGQECEYLTTRITQVPVDLGPVLDAQLFQYVNTGWICVKQDGSLFGIYPSKVAYDLVPPWFPRDICSIHINDGFIATRADGRTLQWSSRRLESGVPATPEQLQKYPHLALPESANNAYKVVAYNGEVALAIVQEASAFQRFLAQYSGQGGKTKDQLFYSITRGQALLDQAVGWWVSNAVSGPSEPPHAGKEGPAAAMRGLQWRLCMAWAGFEIWMKGLLATENTKMDAGTLAQWGQDLPKFDAIDAPKSGRGIAQWIDEEGGGTVLDFLGVNRSDRDTLKAWLLNGQAIVDSAPMVLLAKALRNATAHGALSASTAKELGLQVALEKLPSLLQDFACGALRKYLEK